jgi:hypothetical protein
MIICEGWTLNNKLRASMLIEPSVGANYFRTLHNKLKTSILIISVDQFYYRLVSVLYITF